MELNTNSRPDEIENKKFLYIWIDILGFRNKLLSENEKIYNQLFEIRNKFKEHFISSTLETIISISDGLVLVWDLDDNNLDEIFKQLAELQMQFILEYGYVIRGAISVGIISNELYRKYLEEHNNDIFLISNGLVKAYEMESKDIKWPIIATNIKTIEELRSIKRILNEREFFELQKINGNNEMYLYMIDFLDYLDEDKQIEYENFLLTKLNESKTNKRIFEKYYWLLEYYKNKTNKDIFEKFKEFYNGVLI